MITQTVERHIAEVGWESCVGIMGHDYPKSFGNYFSLSDGLRIINMWSENLREFVKRNSLREIECTVFSDGKHKLGIITDPLIPKDWLYDKLCVTGSGWGSRELCEYIHNYLGIDITNKICGCETLIEPPRISKMFTFASKETSYCCSYCKRIWSD